MQQTSQPEVSLIPALDRTGESRPSSTEIARQWLVKFSAITGKVAEPVLFSIWSEQLGDILPERLHAACDRLMKTWQFPNLPLPGDVRAKLDNVDAKGLELEAANAWEHWLAYVQRYFHPDIGWDRRAPRLDATTEHAGRAAGSPSWVEGCPESELQWCRKRFIEAFLLVRETGQAQHLLAEGEAKRILRSLTAAPLPRTQSHASAESSKTPAEPSSWGPEGLRDLNEVFEGIKALGPAPTSISEEEWNRRWD